MLRFFRRKKITKKEEEKEMRNMSVDLKSSFSFLIVMICFVLVNILLLVFHSIIVDDNTLKVECCRIPIILEIFFFKGQISNLKS